MDIYSALGMDKFNLGNLGNTVLKSAVNGQNVGESLFKYMSDTYGATKDKPKTFSEGGSLPDAQDSFSMQAPVAVAPAIDMSSASQLPQINQVTGGLDDKATNLAAKSIGNLLGIDMESGIGSTLLSLI